MQPHDELYHYGVKGMKWGVRKRLAKSYRRSAFKVETAAEVKRNLAEKVSGVRGVGKPLAALYKMDERYFKRVAARQRKIAKIIEPKYAKPMPRTQAQREYAEKRFNENAAKVATTVLATGIGVAIARPTADWIGQGLKSYFVGRVGAGASKSILDYASKDLAKKGLQYAARTAL